MLTGSERTFVLLEEHHSVEFFDSGVPGADDWITSKALRERGRVATHVACCEDHVVRAFFGLRTIAVVRDEMSNRLAGGEPARSAILITWLAVSKERKGGAFAQVLTEAMRTALALSTSSPVSLLVLDPLEDWLREKYESFGFVPLKPGSNRLGMKMSKVGEILSGLES